MNWNTPKDDWVPADGVEDTDMNEIGENLITLHGGNGHDSLVTVNPDVSNHLDINATDETFVITDNSNNASLILSTGRLPGNRIIIINKSGGSVGYTYGGTPTGDYKDIKSCRGALGYTQLTDSATALVYDGTSWYIEANDT